MIEYWIESDIQYILVRVRVQLIHLFWIFLYIVVFSCRDEFSGNNGFLFPGKTLSIESVVEIVDIDYL